MEGRRYMKDIALIGVTALLACSIAMAQSSGNFTYGNTGTTHCVLNSNGTITGGTTCSAGTCATAADCAALGGAEICANINPATGLGICERTCSTSADCATGQTCSSGVCTGGVWVVSTAQLRRTAAAAMCSLSGL